MNFKEFSSEVNDLKFEDFSTLLSIVNQYRRTQNSLGFLCPHCGNPYFEFWNVIKYTHEHWCGMLAKYPPVKDDISLINYEEISIKCIACGHKLHKGHDSTSYECKDCYPKQSEILEAIFS